ncbi:hypothetical protein FH968_22555 [Buttiauxella sp. B2]|uniref:winged helix-turn-helix transcriptional regulator n=1 Tax=Buttiauxella sp. B2 TaxID=2587812 RepID=UPI00111E0C9E|nr:winged helix-turn-helix transcriptional regulator [Buttiauxella sp. B2]TNV11217.1 hypothetical protein FH968_22555 [Buttiauxella sp. B2]
MSNETTTFQLSTPSPYTIELMQILATDSDYRQVSEGQRLYVVENDIKICHIVRTGYCNIWKGDSNLIFVSLKAPLIMGIVNSLSMNKDIFVETLCPCEVATIPQEKALQLVDQHHKWEIFAKHTMFAVSKFLLFSEQTNAPTAYEILRHQLIALIQEPPEIRENVSAAVYIQTRTLLSRSAIMKILSALKVGGYVVLEHGILKELKKLPNKY